VPKQLRVRGHRIRVLISSCFVRGCCHRPRIPVKVVHLARTIWVGFILTQFRHSYTLRNEPLAEKRHRYNLAGEQQLPVLK